MTIVAGFKLSRAFQEKADQAEILSYREVKMSLLYHIPQFPHVLQNFREKMYDHMNIGLEDLVLIRTVLENPGQASLLLPSLKPFESDQSEPGQIATIKGDLRRLFDFSRTPDPQLPERIGNLLERTDQEIEKRIQFLRNFPEEMRLAFAFKSDAENLMDMQLSSGTRHLSRVHRLLLDWFARPVQDWEDLQLKAKVVKTIADRLHEGEPLQADAFLESAFIRSSTIGGSELDRARRQIADMTSGGQVIVKRDDNPKLVVH